MHSTDAAALLTLWERSVRATHHFLNEADIVFYRLLVADTLSRVMLELWVLTNRGDAPSRAERARQAARRGVNAVGRVLCVDPAPARRRPTGKRARPAFKPAEYFAMVW